MARMHAKHFMLGVSWFGLTVQSRNTNWHAGPALPRQRIPTERSITLGIARESPPRRVEQPFDQSRIVISAVRRRPLVSNQRRVGLRALPPGVKTPLGPVGLVRQSAGKSESLSQCSIAESPFPADRHTANLIPTMPVSIAGHNSEVLLATKHARRGSACAGADPCFRFHLPLDCEVGGSIMYAKSVLVLVALATVAHGGTIQMPLVTVGDPGNVADSADGLWGSAVRL